MVEPHPHQALAELIAVMDRLRSPGGCPWDAQQTHTSLAPHCIEEAFELSEAVASGDRAHLREELGDVLLQVVFHARVAEDDPDDPFDLDAVAAGLTDKLRRRHPHVFADGAARTPDQVESSWEAIKAAEKPERRGPFDGIPRGMPALERAVKVLWRARRTGHGDAVDGAVSGAALPGPEVGAPPHDADIGRALLAVLDNARHHGIDAAAALRAATADLIETATGQAPATDPSAARAAGAGASDAAAP